MVEIARGRVSPARMLAIEKLAGIERPSTPERYPTSEPSELRSRIFAPWPAIWHDCSRPARLWLCA